MTKKKNKQTHNYHALLLDRDDSFITDDDDNIIFFDELNEAGDFCVENGISFDEVRLFIFTDEQIITEATVNDIN